MSECVFLLNGAAVSVFGGVLSAAFCDVLKTARSRRVFACCMAACLLLQAGIYTLFESTFLHYLYPLTVHLPLFLILFFLCKRAIWSLFCVLLAYMCCQPRRWFALLAAAFLPDIALIQPLAEIAVTLPLLFLLLRLIAPVVQKMSAYSVGSQCNLGVVPAIYYIFDYITTVYTELLTSGTLLAVEFMPFVCCAAFLVFLRYSFTEVQARNRLEQIQQSLDIQLRQSVREIDALRCSQELTRRYRHDLRHHLQYLSACIENGKTAQAQSYIADISEQSEACSVQRYCENEAANLLLSSFAGRAAAGGVGFHVHGALGACLPISDVDLCVLLSNALENALHACVPIAAEKDACAIDVQFYERGGKLFLQVVNPCVQAVRFENGIPVSSREGHGIGVQSICEIVRRCGGVCTFLLRDGQFILRLSL
ncbi:MAG: GHKL domain-containing protein [Oscillospiraceae bacterium]|nr:GHKL domain-containing protein [Oscillospiraceae bacterium]